MTTPDNRHNTIEDIAELAFSCVVDSANGIYVGQRIAEVCGEYLDPEDRDILLAGPDHEHYCEAWDAAIDIGFTENGHLYSLYSGESGDVFLVDDTWIGDWMRETGRDFWNEYHNA
jgi:hypothetical protein